MSYESETLYAYDSKGRERMWKVRTEGDEIIVTYGLRDGKQTDKVTKAKGKNIGKKNETTAEEQAILQAKAKYQFQIDREDYHPNIEKSGLQFRPMLAMDYLKVPHRVDWLQAAAQPKLDGLRLSYGYRFENSSEREIMTRKGETYHLPHLKKKADEVLDLCSQKAGQKVRALDGEVYKHGWTLQSITSAARRYQQDVTNKLEFYLFDICLPGVGFIDRHKILTEAVLETGAYQSLFQVVPWYYCPDEEELIKLQGEFMEAGYEGAMIRHLHSPYKIASRSADLFKFKKFFDMECKIVDVWEDLNGNAMLTCTTIEGKLFDCTPKRTHEERKEMLKDDSLIGKWITVKYQELTEDGLPQFPIGLSIRECDKNGNPLL